MREPPGQHNRQIGIPRACTDQARRKVKKRSGACLPVSLAPEPPPSGAARRHGRSAGACRLPHAMTRRWQQAGEWSVRLRRRAEPGAAPATSAMLRRTAASIPRARTSMLRRDGPQRGPGERRHAGRHPGPPPAAAPSMAAMIYNAPRDMMHLPRPVLPRYRAAAERPGPQASRARRQRRQQGGSSSRRYGADSSGPDTPAPDGQVSGGRSRPGRGPGGRTGLV